MARNVSWRRVISDAASWRQDQALNATIYILREIGPTGFLLKEEGEPKHFKVYLGDPHKCSCSVFRKEKDVCKHICWLLLKKFRVPRDNPVTWQLGLVEREINEILRGLLVRDAPRRRHQSVQKKILSSAADGREVLQQKEISSDDVCPICQEELLEKKLPVTYCKFGCGNSIHIKCMKIWADHQKTQGETKIKCPLCREDFGPFELLRQEGRNAGQSGAGTGAQGSRLDRHLGTTCRSCHEGPIDGKCYRCTACADYHLCQSCFNTPIHTDHAFQFRQKRNQRWRPAQRPLGSSLPQAVVNDLLNRDISEGDYDLLLQLDNQQNEELSNIPEEVVHSFPLEKIRETSPLLAPGMQCRVCLRGFQLGQFVRKLPCRHKFHRDCIDPWLIHSHATCPVDGQVIWSPLIAEQEDQELHRTRERPSQVNPASRENHAVGTLEIPGIGLARLPHGQRDNTHESGTADSRRVGESDRQRPTIPNYRDGALPMGLSATTFALSGVSMAGNSGTGEATVPANLAIEDTILGNRLLARARLRRKRINQQLTTMQTDVIPRVPVAPSIPAPHNVDGLSAGISPNRTGSSSAPLLLTRRPPRGHVTSDEIEEHDGSGLNRGRPRQRTHSIPTLEVRARSNSGTRARSSSRERTQRINAQGLQGLFLGQDPRENPAITGELRGTLLSGQAARRRALKPMENRPRGDNHHLQSQLRLIQLEGNSVGKRS